MGMEEEAEMGGRAGGDGGGEKEKGQRRGKGEGEEGGQAGVSGSAPEVEKACESTRRRIDGTGLR